MTPPSVDNAQRLVLKWSVIVFGTLALLYLAGSWWQNTRACRATCEAQGQATSRLVLKGGGRFELGTRCVCGAEAGGK